MACSCVNIIPQSEECYAQQITVDIPPHMHQYRDSRLKQGLSSKVSIDPCIYDEICQLWDMGIITYGSCCGHNLEQSFVNVSPDHIDQMLTMGYVHNHPDPLRKDTFKLKTA